MIICYSSHCQLFTIHRTYQFTSHKINRKQTVSIPFTIAAVSVIDLGHLPHASTCHTHHNSLHSKSQVLEVVLESDAPVPPGAFHGRTAASSVGHPR